MHSRALHFRSRIILALGAFGIAAPQLGCGSDGPQKVGSSTSTHSSLASSSSKQPTNVSSFSTTAAKPSGTQDDHSTIAPKQPQYFTPCQEPTPILQTESTVPSGYISCKNSGEIVKVSSETCLRTHDPTPFTCPEGVMGTCKTNADCSDKPYGMCKLHEPIGRFSDESCGCVYGCQSDADCKPGSTCMCTGLGLAGQYSRCVPATCNNNDACSNGRCSISRRWDGCDFYPVVGCHGPNDSCATDEDCRSQEMPANYCATDLGADRWSCQTIESSCGRPFVIQSAIKTASLEFHRDWLISPRPPQKSARATATELSENERKVIMEHWLQNGLMEHASIASFARFSLQLIHLGAPPELHQETAQAMLDEIHHAKLCFELARRFTKGDIGPGPLPVHGALDSDLDMLSVFQEVFWEGCVGETLAAFEAAQAATLATDPQVKATLEIIEKDEQQHAELGWKTLAWILRQQSCAGARQLRHLIQHLIQNIAQDAATPPRPDTKSDTENDCESPALEQLGLLNEAQKSHIRQQTLREIVLPGLQALEAASLASSLSDERLGV